MRIDTTSDRFLRETAHRKGSEMSGKRLLYACVVVAILVSGIVMPMLQSEMTVGATPDTPWNISPGDGAMVASLQPKLVASAFYDSENHTHCASWWQVRTSAGNYSPPAQDYVGNECLTSWTLETLNYSTTYYWHVSYQDNTGAWSSWSSETSFTTVTPPSVTTNAASSVSTTSATLNLNLTALGTGNYADVCFDWGLWGWYGSMTTSERKNAPGTFSAELTGLNPGTTYHFRAKAVGLGTGYGDDMTFTTIAIPPEAPSVITGAATNIAFTSAKLTGRLSSLGGFSRLYVSFQYGTVPGSYVYETPYQEWFSLETFSADISGLPGSIYYYRAKAVAGGHGTYYGDEMSLTMDTPPPGSNCWAVIVGIAEYLYMSPYEGDLQYTDDDAQALYDVLRPIWGESHLKLLRNSAAIKTAIESAIVTWLDPVEDADDTILLFFSGHGGYAGYDKAPLDETDGRDEYIAPHEASDDESMIFDDQLNTWLSELEAARQVVILDSCFAGGFIEDLSRSGRVVLAATGDNEVGWEADALGHGVFPYYLLNSFENLDVLDADGNNEVSAEELFNYAQPRTIEYEANNDYDSIQHPEIHDGYAGELGLITLATLTIDANPRVASVTLDGQTYSDLPVSVDFLPGTSHSFTFSVATTIDNGVQQPRYTFLSWDDGTTSFTRTVNISASTVYVATYRTQYYLTIESDLAVLDGEGWYDGGTEVSLTADSTPQESPGTLKTFMTWTVDGEALSGNPITVKMDSAHVVTALRSTQYQLTVLSNRGETQGSGWYEAGSEASISVRSTSGVIVRRVFAGWSGDSSAMDKNATVMMDGPKTVEALWKADYAQLYILIAGVLIVAILAIGAVFWIKRRGSHQSPEKVSDGFAP
jgi:hypothetical protein